MRYFPDASELFATVKLWAVHARWINRLLLDGYSRFGLVPKLCCNVTERGRAIA